MRALPLEIALALAAILARPTLRALRAAGRERPNYRGMMLPCPLGILIVAAAVLALVPVTLIERLTHTSILYPQLVPAAVYALGVAVLGAIDDLLGSSTPTPGPGPGASGDPGSPAVPAGLGVPRGPVGVPRGWRGHGVALLRGEPSTGALKAAGSLGMALLAMNLIALSTGRWLLAAGVLVLATNALNLLDLRPGRAVKAFVLIGVGLTVGARELRPLMTLGLFVAPALVAGVYDLRERAMLGDTGANLLGALAGLWIVFTVDETGQLIALALLLVVNVYGELRSISELVHRVPLLRRLDSLGRPSEPLQ